MRSTLIDLQRPLGQKFDGDLRRIINRHDLVVRPMQNQDGNVHLLQVLGTVRLGEDCDAVVRVLEPAHHALLPPGPDQSLADLVLVEVAIEAEEGARRDVDEELGAVFDHCRAEAVEYLHWQATWIRVGLEHERWHGADENRLAHAACTVAAAESRDLAATGRVTDEYDVLQVEVFQELVKVIGVGVHVVSGPGLAGPAVATAVVGDAAVAVVAQEEHLVFPVIAVQRPTMREGDDGILWIAPVLVIDGLSVFEVQVRHVDICLAGMVARYSMGIFRCSRRKQTVSLMKSRFLSGLHCFVAKFLVYIHPMVHTQRLQLTTGDLYYLFQGRRTRMFLMLRTVACW